MSNLFYLRPSLVAIVLLIFSFQLSAQETGGGTSQLIKGVLLDQESNEPLIGASIIEEDTSNGTISDYNGEFEFNATLGATLVVSYIGYTDKRVTAQSDPMTIYLSSDAKVLEEVVVIGYGSQKKSDLTGSISSIGVKELKQLPSTGLEQALQGRSAGVFITQNSGSPGGAMSIRIRGSGSTLSTEPLYVVDGIPISSDNAGSSNLRDGQGQNSNALTTINPNDIESIEILKDASAAAIYGSRAANGVVIITTKSGVIGKPKVSYDFYTGRQSLYRRIPMMDLRNYADYISEVELGTIEEFENPELLGAGTDWQDVIFRNAGMQNHQVSVSGGTKGTRFAASIGAHNKDGIVEGSNFQRYSAKLNLNQTLGKFRVGMNILAARTRENIVFNDNDKGVIYTALLTPPIVPDRTLDGSFGVAPTGENIVLTFDNPLANAIEIQDVNAKSRLLGSLYGEVDITPWLKYRTEFATDLLYSNHDRFEPSFDRGTQSKNSKVTRNPGNTSYWNNKHLLTVNHQINPKNRFTLLSGFEAQEGTFNWLFAVRENLPTNNLSELVLGDAATQNVEGGAGHWALLSYFGRLNYNFDEKYLLTTTFRADGSSRFGPENKFGYFPSVAFAWRLSNEDFIKQFPTIYNLKLRLGYGAVGNQEIGLYSFLSKLRPTDVVIGNSRTTAFAPANIANPGVKWESSIQSNVGLDLGLFNNRIEIVIDAYQKISSDMLLESILPATAGSLAPPFVNIGEIKNTGLEFAVNTQNTVGQVAWKTSANLSINRNEVIDLGDSGFISGVLQGQPITRTEEGQPLGQYFGHKVVGVFRDANEVADHAFQEVGTRAGDLKFEDLNMDGIIDDQDRTYIGNPLPDFTVNLINDVNFKNFDFTVFFRGVFGNEVYNMLKRDIAGTGAWHNQSISVIDRWQPSNPDGTEPRATGIDPNINRRVSDRFVESGSFVRLQNLSLGYTLPSNLTSKFKGESLRFYISGQNLWTVTGYSGYDPEIGSFNQNPLINGVDNGRFPVARSFTVGANVNF